MTTEEMLQQAKDAYHQLMLGRNAIVVVDQNGERIEYQRANSAKLLQYIRMLEDQLAAENGGARPGGPGLVYM